MVTPTILVDISLYQTRNNINQSSLPRTPRRIIRRVLSKVKLVVIPTRALRRAVIANKRIQRHPRITVRVILRQARLVVLIGVDQTMHARRIVRVISVGVFDVYDLLSELGRGAYSGVVRHLVQCDAREGIHLGAWVGVERAAIHVAGTSESPRWVAEMDLLEVVECVDDGVAGRLPIVAAGRAGRRAFDVRAEVYETGLAGL